MPNETAAAAVPVLTHDVSEEAQAVAHATALFAAALVRHCGGRGPTAADVAAVALSGGLPEITDQRLVAVAAGNILDQLVIDAEAIDSLGGFISWAKRVWKPKDAYHPHMPPRVRALLDDSGDIIIADGEVTRKGLVHFMGHPIARLARRSSGVWEYRNGDVEIRLIPGNDEVITPDGRTELRPINLFSQGDEDLLERLISYAVRDLDDRERNVCRRLTLKPSQFVDGDSGQAFRNLRDSLMRLARTTVETTIVTGGIRQTRGFSLLSYELRESVPEPGSSASRRVIGIDVTFSEWLWYAVAIDRAVVTLHPESLDYFGLRRAVYRLARQVVGTKQKDRISIEQLHKRTGSSEDLAKFRYAVRQVLKMQGNGQRFPDLRLSLDSSGQWLEIANLDQDRKAAIAASAKVKSDKAAVKARPGRPAAALPQLEFNVPSIPSPARSALMEDRVEVFTAAQKQVIVAAPSFVPAFPERNYNQDLHDIAEFHAGWAAKEIAPKSSLTLDGHEAFFLEGRRSTRAYYDCLRMWLMLDVVGRHELLTEWNDRVSRLDLKKNIEAADNILNVEVLQDSNHYHKMLPAVHDELRPNAPDHVVARRRNWIRGNRLLMDLVKWVKAGKPPLSVT